MPFGAVWTVEEVKTFFGEGKEGVRGSEVAYLCVERRIWSQKQVS